MAGFRFPRLTELGFLRWMLVSGKSLDLAAGWGDDSLSGFSPIVIRGPNTGRVLYHATVRA